MILCFLLETFHHFITSKHYRSLCHKIQNSICFILYISRKIFNETHTENSHSYYTFYWHTDMFNEFWLLFSKTDGVLKLSVQYKTKLHSKYVVELFFHYFQIQIFHTQQKSFIAVRKIQIRFCVKIAARKMNDALTFREKRVERFLLV